MCNRRPVHNRPLDELVRRPTNPGAERQPVFVEWSTKGKRQKRQVEAAHVRLARAKAENARKLRRPGGGRLGAELWIIGGLAFLGGVVLLVL